MKQLTLFDPAYCTTCAQHIPTLGGGWYDRTSRTFECYQCAGVVPTGLEAVLRVPVARNTTPTPHRRPCARVVVGYARVRNAHLLTNRDSGSKMGMSKQTGYGRGGEVAPTLINLYTSIPRHTALTCPSVCLDTTQKQVSSMARVV